MHHATYAAWANLVSSHSPKVAMWRSYSAKRHTYMYVTRCKACSGRRGVSVRVAIEKTGNLNFIQLLPVARYDAIVLFPLGGAASDSWIRILKGRF